MKKITLLSILLLCSIILASGQSDNTSKNSIRASIPENIRERKTFKRADWFFNQRAFPFDTLPKHKFIKVLTEEKNKAEDFRLRSDTKTIWTGIGPSGVDFLLNNWGIVSGRVRAIAVHPTDPDILYIGAASGGIWKTTDGGNKWLDIGAGLASLSFGAIAIDPANPETVYAGSGESSLLDNYFTYSGAGLYKTMNGGQTWTLITNGFGNATFFGDLSVSPYDSNALLAALGGGSRFTGAALPNEGIWKSSDGGLTWNRTLNLAEASDVAFHPTDPNKVYAAVGGYFIPMKGFFVSNDQGSTWTSSNSGLYLPPLGGRMQFDISKSDPAIIYGVMYELTYSIDAGPTRVYKSINGGASWSQISTGINLGGLGGDNKWYDQGWYDLCIAVDPSNSNHVLIGNIELHRTTNGKDFTPVRLYGHNLFFSLVHNDYHALAFTPSNPDLLYIGCDGGLYKSADKGYTAVSKNPGLSTLQFYRIASHPTNPNVFMGGVQDNGTAITYDGGLTWKRVLMGDGMECFFDRTNPDNLLYVSAQFGWLCKSTNGGSTVTSIFNTDGSWTTPFFAHPVDNNTLYTANKKIYKSTNGGASFQVISGSADVATDVIVTMTQSKLNPDIMIFGTGLDGLGPFNIDFQVKVSQNEGKTWTDVSNNIPGEKRWISRVLTDPVDTNTLYVLRTGFSPGNKVWKTTDLGKSWINISGDLPDLPCSDLFIDPENNRELYLANDIGVYHSSDGGSNWSNDSQGMPYVAAIDFDYVKIGSVRYLRVGTHGRSIYQTLLPNYCLEQDVTFSSQEQIDNFKINYPGCKTIQGDVTISGNITSLNGLNVLSSIGGALIIKLNKRLTSLAGLENIDAGSIDSLFIYQNDSLSMCEVKSVCDYLARPGCLVFIDANAHGCNNPEEVKTACTSALFEESGRNELSIIPNPANDRITILLPVSKNNYHISIYNEKGEIVIKTKLQSQETQIDISFLSKGVYFVKLHDKTSNLTGKFVKE